MELSKRLYTVASAVTPGNRVCDVGTDHGYVPIFLVKQGICPSGIAMDVNKGPLKKAQEHIRENGLENQIATRLSNGLEQILPDETDTIVIAGMGGGLICQILGAGHGFFGKEFILQPQSEWFKVRKLLHENNYRIEDEWFLTEDGKHYVIMKSIPGEERYETEAEYHYGRCLLEKHDVTLKEYLEKEKKKKEEIVNHINMTRKTQADAKDLEASADLDASTDEKPLKNKNQTEKRIQELSQELEWVENALGYYKEEY